MHKKYNVKVLNTSHIVDDLNRQIDNNYENFNNI